MFLSPSFFGAKPVRTSLPCFLVLATALVLVRDVPSGDEAPSEYESMLQKYEAEVRNHIKIEQ